MEPMTLLYFFYAILGIGIIIFLHELGHFLAAKKVGVRVETFCLGFDPTIGGRRLRLFSFRKGDTVYAIGAIPFGGYVKMAGETVLDRNPEGPPPASHELLGKSAGARALVFAAGALFNVISAFLFFILAFRIGVSFTAPVVGHAEPGRPAWKAGLLANDRVLEIDGQKVDDFGDIAISSALGASDRPRSFVIEREGKVLPPVEITPTWSPEYGFHTIGIAPALDPVVTKLARGSAAERAGIRPGDRIVGFQIDGVRIDCLCQTAFMALEEFISEHPGAPFEVGVEGPGGTIEWRKVELQRKPPIKAPSLLGVSPALATVEATRPGSDASRLLAPGDRILSGNGGPLWSPDWITIDERFGTKGPVDLAVESVVGTPRTITVDAGRLISWSLDGDVKWGNQGLRVASVRAGSPLADILLPGDVVVAVGQDEQPVFEPEEFSRWLLTQGGRVVFRYRRDDRVLRFEGPLPAGRGDPGVEWNTTPPVRVFPKGPSARAEILTGSRIVEIAGRPILSWKDLQDAVKASDPKATPLKWIPPGAPPGAPPREQVVDRTSGELGGYESLGFEPSLLQSKVQAGILDSFALGAKRNVLVIEHVFLTIKGLISRQVEAKNLAGPVGIIHLIYRVSEYGIGTLIYYLALISVNLGLFNLLPFPILDGGHLLFLAIEKIKGSPVDVRIQEIVTTVAFFLIIGLALFVTYNDLIRLIGR